MTKKKSTYQTPDILSDLPLRDSQRTSFHFNEFAVTLARLIAEKKTLTPLTICVSGAWGSGKTSLLHCVQEKLDQTLILLDKTKPAVLDIVNADENPQARFRACRTVWFNAWKYADEDELLVALVRVIVQEMFKDDFISKGAAALLEPFTPRRNVIDTVLGWFSIKVGDATIGLNTGVPTPTPFAEKTAMLDLFDEAFDKLMAAWVHHKLDVDKINPEEGVLVVFIDDLDRCLPEKAVQVLEAVKLFLDKPGCVFVLGADADVVCAAVESYYKNAEVTGQNAADYLEKIVQLRFNLPPVVPATMQAYLKTQNVGDEMLAQWQTLIAAAAINPRRVKVVFNEIELQWKMLVNSDQAEGVKREDFIRWSALWRAAPENYKEKVRDFDDLGFRLQFVTDSLSWGLGKLDDSKKSAFADFEKQDGRRLKNVLREIKSFSPDFDGKTLDAFMHLTAPPQKPAVSAAEPPAERPEERMVEAEGATEAALRKETRLRGAPAKKIAVEDELERVVKGALSSENRLVIGGLEFIKVPAGKFIMGSKDDNPLAYPDEKPQHTFEIKQDYWMAKFPVTNEQYSAYVSKEKHPVEGWENKKNHPVMNVSWEDAMAYCEWFNSTYAGDLKQHGLTLHLPTEAQWEKAARGEYGNEWPWGNEFDENKCNSREGKKPKGGTTPVDAYPQGESPYGIADMVGNVWEWTHTLFKEYPYKADKSREDEKASGSRVLRGGAFFNRQSVRCAVRDHDDPDDINVSIGFRVAASPFSPVK